MNAVCLSPRTTAFQSEIALPASKSESNRALILNALAGGAMDQVQNLAEARDTQTMIRLLASSDPVADVLDAGTTMRFLTAYFAIRGAHKTMTGTPRMCERPIGILVDALRHLGAQIDYLGQSGYPPLALKGFVPNGSAQVSIRGDVSSQFISALLMLAPLLPDGLDLRMEGTIGSKPYITMTLAQMAHYGIQADLDWEQGRIRIPAQTYQARPFAVESDWSGASYWYAAVALSPFPDSRLELLGLKEQSLQGDAAIRDIMRPLGVESTFTGRGYLLSKIPEAPALSWDFSHCPDLAQTIAVVAAAKRIPLTLEGIESLKVKETDRVHALQTELKALSASLEEVLPKERYVLSSRFEAGKKDIRVHTYDDHRMAMAFAPVSLLQSLTIEDPSVVNKSYPSFWKHWEQLAPLNFIP